MSLELLAVIAVSAAAVIAVVVTFFLLRNRRMKEREVLQAPKVEAVERWRYRVRRSVTTDSAKEASDELRTLTLEREILSDAIRRLYEAHAEGSITEGERERLSEMYKARMRRVKEAVTQSESVVALHELEAMQEDLTKLFNERFEELNTKIDELRSQIGVEMEEMITPTPISVPTQRKVESLQKASAPSKSTKKKPQRKPQKTQRKAAEERIEKIKAEVEKVLDRLEQMEVEA